MNIDKILKEAYEEIKQEIADGKLGEAKSFPVNPKYTHFAVDKATNKIITGWEYKDLDAQSIAEYIKGDLKDLGVKPSDVTIKTVSSLKTKGVDPFNWDSWKSGGEVKEDLTTIVNTTDGTAKTLTSQQRAAISKSKGIITINKLGTVVAEGEEPTEEEPAEQSGNISDKLSQLISQAIDSAGEVISSTEDKKMETALGKVIKNLTAAQDALTKVSEHEGKLAEEVIKKTAEDQAHYDNKFTKSLKQLKIPDTLVPKIMKIFGKAPKAGMKKGIAPEKLAEKVWSHFTLNESRMNELSAATLRSASDKTVDNRKASLRNDDQKAWSKSISQGKNFVQELLKDFVGKKLLGEPITSFSKLEKDDFYIITATTEYCIGPRSYKVAGSIRITDPKQFGFSQEDAELVSDIAHKANLDTKITPATFGMK